VLRQDQGLEEGAAPRGDRWIGIARSVVALLARGSKRIRRSVRRVGRNYGATAMVYVIGALAAGVLAFLVANQGF
jgi:hypothetical protein